MNFNLVSASALGQPYTLENVAAQDLGAGNFQILLPNPGPTNKFFRLQMSLK